MNLTRSSLSVGVAAVIRFACPIRSSLWPWPLWCHAMQISINALPFSHFLRLLSPVFCAPIHDHQSQARLFPVLEHQQDEGQAAGVTAAAGVVMWMQDVQEHASASASSSSSAPSGLPLPPPTSGDGGGATNTEPDSSKRDYGRNKAPAPAVAEWLAAERLSFKEILARADPGAEFNWRRQLEEGMVEASGGPSSARPGGGEDVGGGR